MRDLDLHAVHAAVAGGSVLAAGGGGWVEHGLLVGTTAVQSGTPRLATLDEVDPAALLATVSAIGAPAAREWEMQPQDYVRALQLLMDAVDAPIVGTVTAQNGSSTTCNGWLASAMLGTLVIDAAGDGRAHPTGKMGSFGLAADPDYQTVQAVAGGNRAQHRYLELVTRGTVRRTANGEPMIPPGVISFAFLELSKFLAGLEIGPCVLTDSETSVLAARSSWLRLGGIENSPDDLLSNL